MSRLASRPTGVHRPAACVGWPECPVLNETRGDEPKTPVPLREIRLAFSSGGSHRSRGRDKTPPSPGAFLGWLAGGELTWARNVEVPGGASNTPGVAHRRSSDERTHDKRNVGAMHPKASAAAPRRPWMRGQSPDPLGEYAPLTRAASRALSGQHGGPASRMRGRSDRLNAADEARERPGRGIPRSLPPGYYRSAKWPMAATSRPLPPRAKGGLPS